MTDRREPVLTAAKLLYGTHDISGAVFAQIEDDSDRAVGIVAASVVEQRLTEAIRARMRRDRRDITKLVFGWQGALATFAAKCHIALLLGIVSDNAHHDLMKVKDIRNGFAHHLDKYSFDEKEIRKLCDELRLVNKYTGPIEIEPKTEGTIYIGIEDHAEVIARPRFRYVMTTQILSNRLIQSALKPKEPMPFV